MCWHDPSPAGDDWIEMKTIPSRAGYLAVAHLVDDVGPARPQIVAASTGAGAPFADRGSACASSVVSVTGTGAVCPRRCSSRPNVPRGQWITLGTISLSGTTSAGENYEEDDVSPDGQFTESRI